MSFATTDDGVRLRYEEAGEGEPILFVHEFAGGESRATVQRMARLL
jgi:pimeloyl-ACP methyl ester carboxylesterase